MGDSQKVLVFQVQELANNAWQLASMALKEAVKHLFTIYFQGKYMKNK